VQRFAGYALTGLTREDAFVFLNGPAGAGKSTLTEALRRTWGNYAVSAPFSIFLAKKLSDGPQEHVARLAGARLVTSVETRDGQHLSEGVLKLLTGGDTVTADRKYEHVVEFVPECKLLLASNFLPRTNADDDGLWRRLRVVRFPVARPRREDRNDSIRSTLTDPTQAGAAILAWAVRGLTDYLAHGLVESAAVMQATAAYRREQEPLTHFVADCCFLSSTASVPAERLRKEYDDWCRREGIREPLRGKAWGNALRALGCTQKRTEDVRLWRGIDLALTDSNGTAREPGEDDSSLFGARR
jgi:putative DNA primase/helicase